jgi:NtrC-family two-component system sensor histidine kinase KinB
MQLVGADIRPGPRPAGADASNAALAVPLSLGLAWWIAAQGLSPAVWLALSGYGLLQLALLAVRRQRHAAWHAWAAAMVDAALALLLIAQATTLGMAVYPLYALLALRAIDGCRRAQAVAIVPFVFGPAYLVAWARGSAAFASVAAGEIGPWGLLLVSLAIGIAAIWANVLQQRLSEHLYGELRDAERAAERRVAELKRTEDDLRTRMRERIALEDGLKAITSTLSHDDVLHQIVLSTRDMFKPRVQAVALSLTIPGSDEFRTITLERDDAPAWAALVARRAMQQHRAVGQDVALIIGDVREDAELAAALPPGTRSVLSMPLNVANGPARGALTITSTMASAFTSMDTRHITAFALQAGIAIGNAEMHSQIRQQQRLLDAVVRDISDGLIVIDSADRIVHANPRGRELLNAAAESIPVRDQVLALARSVRSGDKSSIMSEIRLCAEEGDVAPTYQAIGTLVRQDGDGEPLTAIVLHDITAQKAEEHRRNQFISMVAHELRNPLNSLNGFVKIVLQGRAGALTPLQEEFLSVADTQIEILKGRISELLEYNRVEAGRLNLQPDWNDLPLLVVGTVQRLRLQAQQAGLALYNDTDDQIPEWYFDSERIGQVLTNLIENAIKATPPGGEIRVSSTLNDDEVWIRVSDTGVGIPFEEQRKIFEPFVQGSQGTTRKNHLGLGLAICKQIIEGHQGRLWVESEPGRGTSFTFALPRVERERAAAA